jgi:hypothetical protein
VDFDIFSKYLQLDQEVQCLGARPEGKGCAASNSTTMVCSRLGKQSLVAASLSPFYKNLHAYHGTDGDDFSNCLASKKSRFLHILAAS